MVITEKDTSVLIVGAGPSGLMMACQLLRYGIQPTIIDSKQGPVEQSNALAVQARSLEIYRQMGIVDKVIREGKPSNGLHYYTAQKKAATFSISDAGRHSTPFPFIQIYQQNKNERVLLDYLTVNCCPVFWEVTLAGLKKSNGKIVASINTRNGTRELSCDWLIGADGAHSEVRNQMQIPFNGDTYPHRFYLADVVLENNFDEGYINLFLEKNGFVGLFPLPESKGYRLIGNIPKNHLDNRNLALADVLPVANQLSGMDIKINKCNWFTTYRLHHKMAGQFKLENCFLVGDAAHIHSPVGGQGMNTGLQDAYNLAWKLASVVNGQCKPSILDSYAAERMAVAKKLLQTTDRAFNVIMSSNFFAGVFKKFILPHVLKWLWSKEKIRVDFFSVISQIGIQYRDSKLSLHLSTATRIKAGDRLPFLPVFDEKKQLWTDLHEWCAKPGFTLIAMGKLKEFDLFAIAKWITQHYQQTLNFFYLPPSAKNQSLFDAFEIREGQQKSVIVRPDMYIGFITDWIDMEKMDNYLQHVVGLHS
jgi:2-polyprenyl-6-methoxyphenol hydroxylase-like FAD-dependent oxidoreductase